MEERKTIYLCLAHMSESNMEQKGSLRYKLGSTNGPKCECF